MKKQIVSKQDEFQILEFIKNWNLKGLIKILNKFSKFSREKAIIKETKNKQQFLTSNKLKYQKGKNSYNNSKEAIHSIFTKLDKDV